MTPTTSWMAFRARARQEIFVERRAEPAPACGRVDLQVEVVLVGLELPLRVVQVTAADDATRFLDDDPSHEVRGVVPDLVPMPGLLDRAGIVRVAEVGEGLVALVIAGRERARGGQRVRCHRGTLADRRTLFC